MTQSGPLDARTIAVQLDEWLEVEFSHRNTEAPARLLAGLARRRQEFVLDWVKRLASTHIEIGYQFSQLGPRALAVMDEAGVEAWALRAMDAYDRAGLRPALDVIQGVDDFVRDRSRWASGAALADAAGVLIHFLHGLSGRPLKLEEADVAYTDTETVFLPPRLNRLTGPADNARLYTCTTAFLWAQARFGTFRLPLTAILADEPEPEAFLALFRALDTLRLEAHIARELPGLWREMGRLRRVAGDAPLPQAWAPAQRQLAHPEADVRTVLRLVRALRGQAAPPAPRCYQGELRPEAVEAASAARRAREKALFRLKLSELLEEERRADSAPTEEPLFSHRPVGGPVRPEDEAQAVELVLGEKPVAPPEQVKRLMTSIVQDFGELPDDYLVPAGPGEYDRRQYEEHTPDPDDVWQGTYHQEGATLHAEWDFRRRHYRKNWCVVRECDLAPTTGEFAGATLRKYRGLVPRLRKTFEAMRGEQRMLRRQPQGEDIDIDAVVDAYADSRGGLEIPERLFRRRARVDRDIAVMFMVDMSGSTKGWINDAERETLVLLCEALETLGDRYAIYGFSGTTRLRCEVFPVKRFDEPYAEAVRGRIAAIAPKDYTRMGTAIRHLTGELGKVPARTRLLITLSDGKPDDFDGYYRGDYGIEDTRQALIEARNLGVRPFCITIDKEGPDYLPHMYGAVNYVLVDAVAKLPLRVAEIYRRLTR